MVVLMCDGEGSDETNQVHKICSINLNIGEMDKEISKLVVEVPQNRTNIK